MSAFDVDLAGLLRVFGGHLYSDPGVFVRELVQNAADAIVLRRTNDPAHVGAIRVRCANGVVSIEDDGAGLDRDGIAAALGRIGYSTKRADAPHGTSGQFGIGLLSAFLVADEVEVTTRAVGGDAVRWIGRRDGSWRVEESQRSEVGSTVRLAPRDPSFARPDHLRGLLVRFVRYLPIALWLDDERIDVSPPWARPDELLQEVRRAAGEEVLAATAIEGGVLWIHGDRARPDGSRVRLYQNGILIDESATDLLPRWAGFVSGALDSSALSPTASRETYVRDAAAAELAKTLTDRLLAWLAELPREPRLFDQVLMLHSTHLRGACADSPELMEAIGDRIPLETNHGVVDLPTLRATSGGERALRVADSPQAFAQIAPLATAQGLAVINAIYMHDAEFVRAWARMRGVDLLPVDVQAMALLLRPASDRAAEFATVLSRARVLLDPLDVEPELGRFEPNSLPGFLLTDPTALRERARSIVRGSQSSLARDLLKGLAVARGEERTRFVLNVENPLIRALPSADPNEAAHVVRLLYAQSSMLARRSFSVSEARLFSSDLQRLIAHSVGLRDWN